MTGYPGVKWPDPPEPPRQPKRKPLPEPRLVAGKPVEQRTPDEQRDAALWAMFRTGKRPPAEAVYDIPAIPGSASDTANSHMGNAAGWEE